MDQRRSLRRKVKNISLSALAKSSTASETSRGLSLMMIDRLTAVSGSTSLPSLNFNPMTLGQKILNR